MSVPEGFKRWVRFGPSITSERERTCLDRGVIIQRVGAQAICDSCPLRKEGLEPNAIFDVPKNEKADLGSEKAGLKTWNGKPVCCHMGERAVVSAEDFPELKNSLEP